MKVINIVCGSFLAKICEVKGVELVILSKRFRVKRLQD